MTAILIVLRAVLVAVFTVAGLAKLADRRGSRTALTGFGLPDRLVAPAAVALPVVELVVAAALVPAGSARYGAIAAGVLLLVFAAAIARALRAGAAPDCHCFGRVHSAPAGRGTLVRNLLLAAAAVVVALHVPPSATDWAGDVPALGWFGAVVAIGFAALAWMQLELLRQNGRLLARLDALEGEIPAAALTDLDGAAVDTAELAPGTVLLFSDPGCGPCNALAPEIGGWDADVVVVSAGDPDRVRVHAAEHGLQRVLLDPSGAAAAAFGVAGTPSALRLGGEGPVAGAAAIRLLVGAPAPLEVRQVPARRPVAIGRPAPIEDLPVDGPALVVFWNPNCGYCESMLADLRAMDGDDLLVLSTGTQAERDAIGLRAPVIADEDFALSRRLGASGTPAAILIDGEGRYASDLAVGAPAIRRLTRQEAAA